MTASNFEFEVGNALIIDIYFHHFPQVLRDLRVSTIATLDETGHAMELLELLELLVSVYIPYLVTETSLDFVENGNRDTLFCAIV